MRPFNSRSRRSVANGDSKRCPQVVAADAKRHSAEERAISVKGIEEAELDVKIEGNRATVTSTDTYPVRLEKSGGKWLVLSVVGE